MNPILDASLRAIGLAAVASLSIALMRRRGRLVAPSFEHAIWTCVLLGMLAFALPKFTLHVGEPAAAPIESPYEAPIAMAPATPATRVSAVPTRTDCKAHCALEMATSPDNRAGSPVLPFC